MAIQKDTLFSKEQTARGSFRFDKRVADVFEDMISRSVPGYQQILEMLPTLARRHRFDGANYYDLGCSLGAGMAAMAQGLDGLDAHIIGIDNSDAMLNKATDLLSELADPRFELREQNLLETELLNAGMVLMNFTLQFIPLLQRDALIQRIFDSLKDGGALVLSEKITFDNDDTVQALTALHHQYKSDQGYSDLEISRKRDAIENVLVPETLTAHVERLEHAGFRVVTPWVQNLQFISLLAIK